MKETYADINLSETFILIARHFQAQGSGSAVFWHDKKGMYSSIVLWSIFELSADTWYHPLILELILIRF